MLKDEPKLTDAIALEGHSSHDLFAAERPPQYTTEIVLWCCCRVLVDDQLSGWELIGIYSRERLAVNAALTHPNSANCFVGPYILDATAPLEKIEWPDAYYPVAVSPRNGGDMTTQLGLACFPRLFNPDATFSP